MKCKKGSRRAQFHIVGPSLLMKVVKEEDSFIRFAGHHETNWQWEKRLREFHTDALFREDPFGATEYNIPYSMEKRKRWIVTDILADKIENIQVDWTLQFPYRALRVSASIHSLSTNTTMPILQRPVWGWRYGVSYVEELPTQEYHDVLRDGRVKHRVRKHATLVTLDRDAKEEKKKRRKTGVVPDETPSTSNLPFDEDQRFQKAHVRYNVIKMVHDKRPVHPHNVPSFSHSWMYDTTQRDREREKRELISKELRELENDEIDASAMVDENSIDDSEVHLKNCTLMDCVVQKKFPKKSKTRPAKNRFIDEVCTAKISFPERGVENEEEDFEVVPPSKFILSISDQLPTGEAEGACPICVEPFDDWIRPFSLDCGHAFCADCWVRQAQVCLDMGCDDVTCMEPTCTEILSNASAMRLLSPASIAYYLSTVQEVRIRKGKARRCPQCRWTVSYSGHKSDSCSCGALLCGLCPFLYHGSLSCGKAAQYNAYLKMNGFASLLSPFPSSNVVTELVRCPACTTPLQRSVGCDHMVCVCGAPFCFRCGRERDVKHANSGECRKKEQEMVVLIDVFARTGAREFSKKLLKEALRRRVELAMRKREITDELSVLPLSKARMCIRRIEALSVLLESTILVCSDKRLVSRIELALYRFLNRTGGHGGTKKEKLIRRAEEMIADCDKIANIN